MFPEQVRLQCEQVFGQSLSDIRPVTGGDINEAFLIQTNTDKFFIKLNDHPAALDMLRAEAAGLARIKDSRKIQTPAVIHLGKADTFAFLILEYIQPSSRSQSFWQSFGQELAQMHQIKQPNFGLDFDNFIGSLPQKNPASNNWPNFYRSARLQPLAKIASEQNRLHTADLEALDRLFNKLPDLLPDESPSLIHGDLWSGNFLAGKKQKAVLIDPAVCYAHREMDIAMSKLFGGFSPTFYQAYLGTFPLLTGWEDRIPLYQLYYLLVHVILFGGGYVQSVRQVLQRYVN